MAQTKSPAAQNSGNSKNPGLQPPSLKLSNRGGDVIYARSSLLNSLEMRARMDALAESWRTAEAPDHTYLDAFRFEQDLREVEATTDGLFDSPKLHDLASQWETVKDYLNDCPDWAGVFCGVGMSEPTGVDLRLYENRETESHVVDDRRHAGKGPHHRNLDTIDRAVLSLRHRLRTGYASMSDETAAEEWNAGRELDEWAEPTLIKRDRQKLRELVRSLG
jgi:hypothetical protein